MREKSILEVGAGTGLASLIAARCGASRWVGASSLRFSSQLCSVLATDLKDQVVLDLLQRNMTRNASLAGCKVSVMPLDFNDDLSQVTGLEKVDLVLAGDVIYDDGITDSFVKFLLRLRHHSSGPLKVLATLERRVVFTVADLEERCPAFEHLMLKLEEEKERVVVKEIEIDWEQHLCYERSNELVLLQILVL